MCNIYYIKVKERRRSKSGNTDIETTSQTHIEEIGQLVGASNKLSDVLHQSVGDIKESNVSLKSAIGSTVELIKASNDRTKQINAYFR